MSNKNFFTKSISTKLIASFLLASIVPIVIVGLLSYNNAGKALENAAFNQLESVGTLKKDQISSFIDRKFRDLQVLAVLQNTLDAFSVLRAYHDEGGATPDGPFDINSTQYQQIYKNIDPFFRTYVKEYNFHDIFFMCAAHGHVMYTAHKEMDLGTNLSTGPYRESGLAKLWKKIVSTKSASLVDFSYYALADGSASFIGAPVFNNKGEMIAVLALQLSVDRIDGIMQERTGMGETGETYLVGDDLLMRSDSRFSTKSTILEQKVDTESSKKGLQGNTGIHIIDDYRGISVLSYYTNVGLQKNYNTDFEWVVISEIDKSEALAPVYSLRNQILTIGLIITLVVAIFAFLFARVISSPIVQLTGIAKSMAIGDLSREINVTSQDEIGELANSFRSMQTSILEKAGHAEEIAQGNLAIEVKPLSDKDTMSIAFKTMLGGLREKAAQAEEIANGNLTMDIKPISNKDIMGIAFKTMVDNLSSQINEIKEGVNVLASSTSEIMASVSQLASSAAETATSVGETTTTAEEVKQTAEVSSQKAQQVSESGQKTSEISKDGTKAIEDTIEGMNKIRQQMESIANMVVKLSEQSVTIGEITSTVSDLAEQSNLLAVNAAIEAAKAGEQGKGFAVVAQEIKNLADRSKEATAQVRGILNDIQKSISSAVMATEEGGKAVVDGLELSKTAGESIQALSESVAEAAQAAIQIASSSQQQLAGMDQVVTAMESIKEASVQTAASTKQSEISVGELHKLGEKLQELVKQYKLE